MARCRKSAESCARAPLCGLSDLAEIAVLRAADTDIEVVGIYDPHTERRRFAGKSVWRELAAVGEYDVCVLTDLNAPLIAHQHLVSQVAPGRVMVPTVLGISEAASS